MTALTNVLNAPSDSFISAVNIAQSDLSSVGQSALSFFDGLGMAIPSLTEKAGSGSATATTADGSITESSALSFSQATGSATGTYSLADTASGETSTATDTVLADGTASQSLTLTDHADTAAQTTVTNASGAVASQQTVFDSVAIVTSPSNPSELNIDQSGDLTAEVPSVVSGDDVTVASSTSGADAVLIDSAGTATLQPIVTFAPSGLSGDSISITDSSAGVVYVTTTIKNSGTAIVATDSNVNAVSQDYAFTSVSETLKLDAPISFTGTISNFQAGDTIDLAGLSASGAAADSSGNLIVQETGGGTIALTGAGLASGQGFLTVPDGSGGTDIMPGGQSGNYFFYSLADPNSTAKYNGPITIATAINDNGVVAGYYSSNTSPAEGFQFANGTFSSFDLSGMASGYAVPFETKGEKVNLYFLYPTTISNADIVSGEMTLVTGALDYSEGYGFIYQAGSLVPIFDPNSSTTSLTGSTLSDNMIAGVGNDNVVYGKYETFSVIANNLANVVSHNFTYNNGVYADGGPGVVPNASGEYAGTGGTQNDVGTYLNGVFTPLSLPGLGVSNQYQITGINNAGVIVGNIAGGGVTLNDGGGFVYDHGTFTKIIAPGATWADTEVNGINNNGEIVGAYYIPAPNGGIGVTSGFTASLISPVACFLAGTHIATPDGESEVENLVAGDLVRARCAGHAPIKWIGHRHVDCRRHPKPQDVWPVRIMAGAFGPGMPNRNLWLSPDHAVFAHEVLIPIKYLINGATISQQARDEVTYWHVELAEHDVLSAEGLPCETYLDTGSRSSFANGGCLVQMHADFGGGAYGELVWEARACAKLRIEGPEVQRLVNQLRRRARELGIAKTIRKQRSSSLTRVRTTSDLAALVKPAWYLATYPDVAAAGLDATLHYIDYGRAEGRLPCPEIDLIRGLGLIDPSLIAFTMPDLVSAGIDLVEHFCSMGWRERRRPNPYFDTGWYLDSYHVPPDVNPLAHYVVVGERRGYQPCEHFDPPWYARRYALRASESPLAHYLKHRHRQRFSPLPSFDVVGYRRAHATTLRRGCDPYAHFLSAGHSAAADADQALWLAA